MKQVLEVIIKNLVDNKDAVSINEIENEKGITLQVKVDDSDIGKIIGKQGKTAKAIRTLMKAAGAKYKKRLSVEILD